jgi:hypothetical protein
MDVKDFPHLKNQSAEFIELADAEAVINGITIPMHSHVLAKNSKVFAQFFSSLTEDDDGSKRGTPGKPTSVTHWFDGESLETVIMILLLFYNPENKPIGHLFQSGYMDFTHKALGPAFLKYGLGSHESIIKFADKLDCRCILDEIDKSEHEVRLVWTDPLGWLVLGRALGLYRITNAALNRIVAMLSIRPVPVDSDRYGEAMSDDYWSFYVSECTGMLSAKDWTELDNQTMMLVLEAKTLYNLHDMFIRPGAREHIPKELTIPDEVLKNYSKPGDLVRSQFPNDGTVFPVGDREEDPLDEVAEALEQQALDDFNDEWDDGEHPEVIDD